MGYIYDFDEPARGGRDLLGGKGAGLAELTRLGLPVRRSGHGAFCHDVGLDHASCSPYRVPLARLAASQAAVRDAATVAS